MPSSEDVLGKARREQGEGRSLNGSRREKGGKGTSGKNHHFPFILRSFITPNLRFSMKKKNSRRWMITGTSEFILMSCGYLL
jgi:hypothetical protein